MIVSLFTARVILNTLGVVDYGLNNVVAGVITLFAFLNNALATSTSRFLTFELGKKNGGQTRKIFSTSFNIHFCMAVIVVVFCETAGLWIVNNFLAIPADRLYACNVIYQFVIISAFLSITQAPLTALIISHERMKVYAYLGVSDAILRLCVAYLITISPFDKLITLGTLQLFIAVGMYIFYHLYCKYNFSEYIIAISRDKKIYGEMIGYSLWSLLGSSAIMLKNQGVSILINIFFGPIVNATNAIAYQVNQALTNFSNNFTTALKPQIIKSYASDEHERMKTLIFTGGKFSFFLLMLLSIPILLETNTILRLWLGQVPEYSVSFTRLIIILSMIECFAYTISTGIQATGNIRNYLLFVSGVHLLNFPLTFLFFKFGSEPSAALTISIILSAITIFIRLFFIRKFLKIDILEYSRDVLLICFVVFILSILPPWGLYVKLDDSILKLFLIIMTSTISSIIFIYQIGLKNEEKRFIISTIKKKIHNRHYIQ